MTSLPLFFALGAFSSLSPCLFPLLTSFLAYTANIEGSASKGILAGLACMAGIALSFSVYGAFASLLVTPLIQYWTPLHAAFGLIIVGLGAASYAQKIQLYYSNPRQLFTRRGYIGVFVLGLTYTLIAAPCAMPIFLSAVIAASTLQSMASTLLNLLTFSVGAALPFLASPLLMIGAKNTLGNQYLAYAKWLRPLSALVLILTGLLLFIPILGLPSIFY